MAIYLHGYQDEVLRSHRWRTAANSAAYLLPSLRPGLTVLDVGSGAGTITVDLAALVDPSRVTAVEISGTALDLARAEAQRRQQTNIDFVVSDVHALDFADDSFDVVHAHQVLQHVADPVQALREMRRVTKPGGVVGVRDSDYAGFTWYPAEPELDQWLALYRGQAVRNGGQPDAGRHLLHWAHEVGADGPGFASVTATSSTWCFATEADREYWGGMWADRIVKTDIANQLLASGAASQAELTAISAAWRRWAGERDGWFSVLHGELLCTV
jgi:SAM-dependent methyltransferase